MTPQELEHQLLSRSMSEKAAIDRINQKKIFTGLLKMRIVVRPLPTRRRNDLPLTPEGRVTAKILQFNLPERILKLEKIITIGEDPPD